jgi:hypothetical protein
MRVPLGQLRLRFSLRTLVAVMMLAGPVLWFGGRAYRWYAAPDPAWLELRLRGSWHMQQHQADRLGIAGPLDRLRELREQQALEFRRLPRHERQAIEMQALRAARAAGVPFDRDYLADWLGFDPGVDWKTIPRELASEPLVE